MSAGCFRENLRCSCRILLRISGELAKPVVIVSTVSRRSGQGDVHILFESIDGSSAIAIMEATEVGLSGSSAAGVISTDRRPTADTLCNSMDTALFRAKTVPKKQEWDKAVDNFSFVSFDHRFSGIHRPPVKPVSRRMGHAGCGCISQDAVWHQCICPHHRYLVDVANSTCSNSFRWGLVY